MVTHLSINVAEVIASGESFSVAEFAQKGAMNEYLFFPHRNFFYSYPEWGKKWPNGKDCQFHKVNTACNCCGQKPSRNQAGVGCLYLLKSEKNNRDFVLLCNSCKDLRSSISFKHNTERKTKR